MNSRETLVNVAEWLGYQDETLSFGLRNAFDALRLYDYAQAHPNLPEMADEWTERQFIAALGYNPMTEEFLEVKSTGADAAAAAMKRARRLLDSVAFVAKEGDTKRPLSAIDEALGHSS